MKKLLGSLPARLVLGVLAGILVGLWAGSEMAGGLGETVMQVILTLKNLLGSLITFCVPLIVIGFIAPSITRLKSNASRMLGLSLLLAYTSSVCAALLSAGAGFVLIPGMSIQSSAEGLRTAPELLFQLEISPIMPVISALVFSVLIGLAATWTQAGTVIRLLEEFQHIVLEVVTRIIIPILPFFIAGTFCGLAYEGSITRQLPVFLLVILIVLVGHYLWLAVLYGLAAVYSGENPWQVLRHYGPAYLTAVGTMSSAARTRRMFIPLGSSFLISYWEFFDSAVTAYTKPAPSMSREAYSMGTMFLVFSRCSLENSRRQNRSIWLASTRLLP